MYGDQSSKKRKIRNLGFSRHTSETTGYLMLRLRSNNTRKMFSTFNNSIDEYNEHERPNGAQAGRRSGKVRKKEEQEVARNLN